MSSIAIENNLLNEPDSDDEFDWEEVEVPDNLPQHLEITLQARPKAQVTSNKKKGISHAERLIRIDCHKIHTVALLGNARIRNHWINDPLLHARLLSLTPLELQTAFATIHKSRIPDHNQRGRMFEAAITNLVNWWSGEFFEVISEGHIRNRTFDDVQQRLQTRGLLESDPDDPEASTLDLETLEDIFVEEGERIRSSKSLMKHALMHSGTRDTSAQLFTSLCRALGVPARLVVSLQSVPWQSSIGKPKPKYERKPKGKGKEKATGSENNSDMEEVDISSTSAFPDVGQRLDGGPIPPKSEKAKGKEKAKPVIRLRKTKSKGRVLGRSPVPSSATSSRLPSPDPTTTPPIFWTEVFSRPDARWLPVDPIRAIVNKRKVFDPTPTPANASAQHSSSLFPASGASTPRKTKYFKEENRMVYVLAFEEDGYARDVTRRYAKEYNAKIAKVQGGSSAAIGGGGKGRKVWWERVVSTVTRPYRLNRDDSEDAELDEAQLREGMPATVGGFKDHPLYVLERHLKQTEIIHPAPPATPELGKFRGEPVYPRSSVVPLKTAENWMRSEGRTVIAGSQPLKMVKLRAGTVNRIRELEVLKDELKEAGSEAGEVMQGLYARLQTELYVPDPVVNGKIPKNNFGNLDLYVPSMLPKGAVHVPFKGVAKIARKLRFDFAEAVIGFEFKKRRAYPVLEGVVIAQENEAALLEAYWAAEEQAQEKARLKRRERALKQWKRMIYGLRIRERLQKQYANKPEEEKVNTSIKSRVKEGGDPEPQARSSGGGGFLIEADDVVQAFHLPKILHPNASPTPSPVSDQHRDLDDIYPDPMTYDLTPMDVDDSDHMGLENDVVVAYRLSDPIGIVPKTMQELAEDAARRVSEERSDRHLEDAIEELSLPPPPPPLRRSRLKGAPQRTSQRSATVRDAGQSQGANTNKGARRSPRKKRKTESIDEDEDEESEAATNYDDDDSVEELPRKRKRTSKEKVTKTRVAVPPPTRTLRPRKSKTAAQIEEEEQTEIAYRRAVAE